MRDTAIEDLLRSSAPQVLGAVVRRFGHFDLAEDAVQEALLAAATRWPTSGIPDDPRAWLVTVASRRLTDLLRSEQARRHREDVVAQWVPFEDRHAPAADVHPQVDDTLVLLFLCCHSSLTPASQVALALGAVGGLTTGEIARAFLVSEDTMTRRITRAKKRIETSGEPLRMPVSEGHAVRLAAVLHMLYLIFTEGYAATAGPHLVRLDLSSEAIRLTRSVHRSLPSDAETAGLLALMLLTDARRAARVGAGGTLIPMSEQDRSLWRRDAIAEGTALVTDALRHGDAGPYQVQAAIAAVHARATSAEETEWSQIVRLYRSR
ncbi:RNA polymerase sigma factor [Rhodococcus sp. NPDC060086]|uniref:RNA polymerase sigma factor n=1 Tax=Rhodococcus sp. NPDC060086 TaxID=3347055 RepID=UPI0036610152